MRRLLLAVPIALASLACERVASPNVSPAPRRLGLSVPGPVYSRVVGDITVTALGGLRAGRHSVAYAVSSAGHVVGEAETEIVYFNPLVDAYESVLEVRPFLWVP